MDRNVVLICLDTVRKDFFDAHADRIQERADVDFEECRAASSWSVPSHASMFSGELPHQHGVHTHQRDFSELTAPFTDQLSNHHRIGISANPYAGPLYGFDSFFDEYTAVSTSNRYPDALSPETFFHESESTDGNDRIEYLKAALSHENPVQSILNGVCGLLHHRFAETPINSPFDDGASIISKHAMNAAENTSEPFFMFLNFMDAHGPFQNLRVFDSSIVGDVPSKWSSKNLDPLDVTLDQEIIENEDDIEVYQRLYEASIEYLDRIVAELIDRVQAETDRETTFVITSDHGENFGVGGEEPVFGHVVPVLTEELLHVPYAIVNLPENVEADEADLVSHLDLGDHIVSLAKGREDSLSSAVTAAEVVGFGVVNEPRGHTDFEEWSQTVRCVYSNGAKLTWGSNGDEEAAEVGGGELESDDVRMEELMELKESVFDSSIDEFMSGLDARQTDIDPETKKQLAELGYA